MAAEWIPWVKGLARKREVLVIAAATGRTRRDVAATLMEFWEWARDQGDNVEETIPGVSLAMLPLVIDGTDLGFWQAVRDAGWLDERHEGVYIPTPETWVGGESNG